MKILKILMFLGLSFLTGCSLDSMFQQPQVTVINYELVGLPGETRACWSNATLKTWIPTTETYRA